MGPQCGVQEIVECRPRGRRDFAALEVSNGADPPVLSGNDGIDQLRIQDRCDDAYFFTPHDRKHERRFSRGGKVRPALQDVLESKFPDAMEADRRFQSLLAVITPHLGDDGQGRVRVGSVGNRDLFRRAGGRDSRAAVDEKIGARGQCRCGNEAPNQVSSLGGGCVIFSA